jgi:hypothetical protein
MNRSKQDRMARKTVVALLVGLALASVRFVEAQQPAKIPKMGSSQAVPLPVQLQLFQMTYSPTAP